MNNGIKRRHEEYTEKVDNVPASMNIAQHQKTISSFQAKFQQKINKAQQRLRKNSYCQE